MPVSPQDFALWSRMTGNPYPQTPAERMALAPEVYNYTRQIGRQGGPTMSPVRRAIDVAGKVALGAGLVAGAGYLASKGFQKLQLDNEPEIVPTVVEEMPNYDSPVTRNSGDVTSPLTSDNYNQDVVAHQTSGVQALRGTTPQKPTLGPIEQKVATQSEVIGSQQHFSPGSEEQQLSGPAQPNPSIRAQAEELIGRVSAAKLAKFRQSPSYAATVKPLDDEELIGDATPYVEPSPKPSVMPGPVRMTPQTRVAVVKEESPIAEMSTVATPVDVGSALKSKGIYLSGDIESGTVQVNTDKGGSYAINHPYSAHPKSGIRQTALQEEQMARDLLQSAGVTPEQVKDYWAKKTKTFGQPEQVAVTPAPVTRPQQIQKVAAPVGGASSAEIRELDQLLARSHARHTQEQRIDLRNQLLAKKYGGGEAQAAASPIVTTSQPQPVRVATGADVKQKLFQKAASRPPATTPGTEEHLVAEALEQREGMREPPPGTQVFNFPSGGTRQVKLYPNQQVGIVHSNDPMTEYGYKSSPEYYGELESMLKSGQFTPGGTGFIQAGRNLGYLY